MPETGLRQTFSSFTGLLSAGGAAGAAPAGTRSGAGPMLRPPRLCDIVAGDSGSAASTSTSYVFPSIVMFSFMALPKCVRRSVAQGTFACRVETHLDPASCAAPGAGDGQRNRHRPGGDAGGDDGIHLVEAREAGRESAEQDLRLRAADGDRP